nr:hypothetical protein [uncultured Psychroserpens sp.]
MLEEPKTATINSFVTYCESYKEAISKLENRQALKLSISKDYDTLISEYITLGDEINEDHLASVDVYMIHYELSQQFKDLTILHRDVYLELVKGDVYEADLQISNQKLETHFLNSKTLVLNALETFISAMQQAQSRNSKDKNFQKKILKIQSLQKDPWDIYKVQLQTIQEQLVMLESRKKELLEASSIFNKLKDVVKDVNKKHDVFQEKIFESINFLAIKAKESTTFKEFLVHVEDRLNNQKFSLENNHQTFSEAINNHIADLKKIEVPIKTQEGLIMMREIDFNKRTNKWFDYQILPGFMDLEGLETNLLSLYNVNLLNLKNTIQLTKSNDTNNHFDNVVTSLSHLQENVEDVKLQAKNIAKKLHEEVNNELIVSNAFKNKPFIEVPLNSSLSIEGNTILKTLMEKWNSSLSFFNSKYEKSKSYESLSNLEISTQCMAHRMHKDESQHYDSLFLNKNFIGDLFLVSRQLQEEKLETIVNQWQKGFNKSVLVIGNRLSGRSTFLNYSSKKRFGKHTVILKPNSTATIDGRKFTVTYDLKEALQYVKNNNIESTKPALIIDDIELWRDKDHSLLSNIRSLINFIETESDDVFVMISTSIMMKDHLDQRLNFSNAFSHVLDLNQADKNEISQAILLRHGAAHRELVDEKLEPITPQKVMLLAAKMSKIKHYNFGDTLQSWTYNTFVQDDEKVVFKESYLEFVDFFTKSELIILKQALIFKNITEYGLKRVVSNAFDQDYKSAIRRLVNVKILLRDPNGTLFINPVVVNNISRIINKEHSN